ncbi:MAG: 50S ribosomal protein L11 methyltransferase [Calditerrivibrio sp.]|nr:50S ribosomal protein L11 methyltransferase [Calditerrivibrio sp.]MCA1933178.1 50S ribosomal protein L11 methyltransferase [Calditerrivibrio sp.]MCA1980117.1 50S ribosomal protein L11 methyltransferase [Calditerrivibrio sp.]
MLEVRFKHFDEKLLEIIEDSGLQIIEEDFKGEISYTIYCNKDDLNKFLDLIIDSYEIKDIQETGWETKWRDFIKPGNLTPNIRYIFEKEDTTDPKTILINPSLAFGTGTHPTTQLAATLLEEVCNNRSVIDIGCGSGILSIAAKLSGASKIYAFDNDSNALINTKENIMQNKADSIIIWAGSTDSLKTDFKVEIVVANIISSVLLSIQKDILRISPEYVIVSGILSSEQDNFTSDFLKGLYSIDKFILKDDWLGIRYRRIHD